MGWGQGPRTQGVKGAPVLLRNLPLMKATFPWVPLEPNAADLSPLVAWRTVTAGLWGRWLGRRA